MKQLNPNWLTEGLIDFEYKKYVLLAYLKEVSHHFQEGKLFPALSDIIFHYQNLFSLKENKEIASRAFPKQVSRIDLEQFRLEYERMMNDEDYMEEIQQI